MGGGADSSTNGGVAGKVPGGEEVVKDPGRVQTAAELLPGVPLTVGGAAPGDSGFRRLEGVNVVR